ncbi:hypothetical protein [Pedobacter sp.]
MAKALALTTGKIRQHGITMASLAMFPFIPIPFTDYNQSFID